MQEENGGVILLLKALTKQSKGPTVTTRIPVRKPRLMWATFPSGPKSNNHLQQLIQTFSICAKSYEYSVDLNFKIWQRLSKNGTLLSQNGESSMQIWKMKEA